jgi:hypothetical protein
MNFLKKELGINNIQNLRRPGTTGTQKLKNIGAFIGKTAGNLLLAGSLLGGLAKAGSVGASLIKEDMEVGFRRFGRTTNPLERYGNPHRIREPSTLARPFPGHRSLTRAVYDSTGLGPIRLKRTNRVFELPLPAHEWFSDLFVRQSFSSRWLGEEPQTLAKINELRGPLNYYYRKKKQNKVRELCQTWETNLRRRGNIGLRGQGSFPERFIGEFFQPRIPELVENIPPFVPQRHTAEINQLMDDYYANILKNDRKSRAVNRFIDAVMDQKFASRRIRSDIDISFEEEYLNSRNFQSVDIQARIHSMREYSRHLQATEDSCVFCCCGCCVGLLCVAGCIACA